MNRRQFIQSIAALAATAVVKPTLAKLIISDEERLIAQMKSGFVCDQTFVFYRPVTLNVSNVIFYLCDFIWKSPEKMDVALIIEGERNCFRDCAFDFGNCDIGINMGVKSANTSFIGGCMTCDDQKQIAYLSVPTPEKIIENYRFGD